MLIAIHLIIFLEKKTAATDEKLTEKTSSRNQHPICKQSEVEHSDIVHDRGLGHLSPKNYTFLGNVPAMSDCMAMCCSTKHCNIAYMKNNSCFGVTCYDADKCGVKNGTVESGTKLALMIRNEMNRRGERIYACKSRTELQKLSIFFQI